MTNHYSVRRLDPNEATVHAGQLAEVLLDCVEGGASVSFMLPMTRETAARFLAPVHGI